MENIVIRLPEVSSLAERIHQINVQISETLKKSKETMSTLANYWESLGANEIRSRFNTFSLRFEEQYQIIEQYVQFLHHTVESYDSLESTIHANANNF